MSSHTKNFPGKDPRLLAVLLLSSVLGTGVSIGLSTNALAGDSAPISVTPTSPQAGFAQLVTRVKPAVVQIATVSGGASDSKDSGVDEQQIPNGPFGDMLRRYFGQQGRGSAVPEQRALGSGFIVDPAGYIVTNNHVVEGARDVSVTLTNGDKYKAKVIGRDVKTDLAPVKIEAGHPLPYVAFGDSDDAHEGDWVIAVGNPYGLGGTVTAGIISAHGRNISAGPYDDFMQIDAPINPGNSGGPLFNQSGQVVGIDTAIYSPSGGSVGIGFAIPSNVAKSIVAQLRDHGAVQRGWLGVAMQPLTPSLAKAVGLPSDHGVLVNTVTEGSPAAKADLRQGDVITAFNGTPIKDARDLAMAVAETPAGRTVPVTLWRDDQARTVRVEIRKQEDETKEASAGPTGGPAKVGMALAPLSSDLREQLNVPANVSGVIVEEVMPDSVASESGIQAGDIILRVAGTQMRSPEQIAAAIEAARKQKKPAVSMLVWRDGKSSFLGLQLSSDEG